MIRLETWLVTTRAGRGGVLIIRQASHHLSLPKLLKVENFPQWLRQPWGGWRGAWCEADVPDNPPGHHPLLHGPLQVLPPPRLPGEGDDQQRLDQVSQGGGLVVLAELKVEHSRKAGQFTFIANKSRCFPVV